MNYIYEAETIAFNMWTGGSRDDYLEIINKRGENGWRFVGFVPLHAKHKGVKGTELVFEKAVVDVNKV